MWYNTWEDRARIPASPPWGAVLTATGGYGLKSRFCFILLPLLCIAASSVTASAPVSVSQYLALRNKLATRVAINELKADSGSYIGKVFEIRGMLTGCAAKSTSSQGCSIIMSNPDDGSYSVSADTPPTKTPGIELACLVKIGERSSCSLSDLRLVACTFLADLKRVEAAAKPVSDPAPKNASAAARGAQRQAKSTHIISAEELVRIYSRAVKNFNRKLSNGQADTIARSILGFSYRYDVDSRLVCAVILAESHFRIGATSRAGAQGLGQLMPTTAAGLGVNDAYDPVQNIYGSVRYVRSMLDRLCSNKAWSQLTWYDLALALAGYNAGAGAVKKHGGVPPYRETQNYVRRVTSIYKQLCGVK